VVERQRELRASDEDREHVIEELREHAAVGCLTIGELADRTEQALRAKTLRDLAALTVDLPRLRRARTWPLRRAVGAHLIGNGAAVAVWVATTTPDGYGADGRSGVFWPAVGLLVSILVLARRALRVPAGSWFNAVRRAPTVQRPRPITTVTLTRACDTCDRHDRSRWR
jgi:hypothetical protein